MASEFFESSIKSETASPQVVAQHELLGSMAILLETDTPENAHRTLLSVFGWISAHQIEGRFSTGGVAQAVKSVSLFAQIGENPFTATLVTPEAIISQAEARFGIGQTLANSAEREQVETTAPYYMGLRQ